MVVPEERLLTARDLFALHFVGDPQLSPDGTRVACVVTTIDEAPTRTARASGWWPPTARGSPAR